MNRVIVYLIGILVMLVAAAVAVSYDVTLELAVFAPFGAVALLCMVLLVDVLVTDVGRVVATMTDDEFQGLCDVINSPVPQGADTIYLRRRHALDRWASREAVRQGWGSWQEAYYSEMKAKEAGYGNDLNPNR